MYTSLSDFGLSSALIILLDVMERQEKQRNDGNDKYRK